MSSGQAEFPAGGLIASQVVATAPPLYPQALGGSSVPAACDQNIEDVAALVHCPPETAALPADRVQDQIHAPDIA